MVAPAEIQTGYSQRDARTHSSLTLRLVGANSGRLASLEFQAHAVAECIPFGLLNIHQDVLLRLSAIRILHRRTYLAEDAEIVQPLLSLQHVDLAKWVAGRNFQFALHNKRLCVVQP